MGNVYLKLSSSELQQSESQIRVHVYTHANVFLNQEPSQTRPTSYLSVRWKNNR